MFHNFFQSKKSRLKKQPEVPDWDYIDTPPDPAGNIFDDLPFDREVERQTNIFEMRRDFRRTSKKIRDFYAR